MHQPLETHRLFCVQRQDRVVYPWGLTRLTWIDLRWTLLLRVLRLGKVKQCLRQIQHYIPNYKTASCVLRLLQLLTILFLLGNLFGCLWFYSAAMTPRGSFQYTETWVEQKDLSRTGETGLTPVQQWMAALYWAFTTLTTTGYGDISANTQSEHLLVIAATLIGVTCNAIIIGQMGVLVVEMSETATTQRRHLKNLNTFCTIHRLPESLRSRLHETHSLVMARMHAHTDMDGRKLLRFVPPAVRREVFMHVHQRIITAVPILKFNSMAVQHFIAPLLQPAIYLPGEYISYIGEPSQSICFVLSGEVAIIDGNGFITHLLEAGGFLGEKSVLSGAPRETSARAIHEISECYHIDREDTKQVLRCFPEFRKTLELAGCLRSATTCLEKRTARTDETRSNPKSAKRKSLGADQNKPNASSRLRSYQHACMHACFAAVRCIRPCLHSTCALMLPLSHPSISYERPQTPPPGYKSWNELTKHRSFVDKFNSILTRSRTMQGAMFDPQPYNLSSVTLPLVMQEIAEQVTHNNHEVWAEYHIEQGWIWGSCYDAEKKLHPCILPYHSLTDAQRATNSIATIDILKIIMALEYQLDSTNAKVDKVLSWRFGEASSPRRDSEQKVSAATEDDRAQFPMYEPRPLPTPARLPKEYEQPVDMVASCCHVLWARRKLDAGWSFAHHTDESQMRHNCLVPYEYLATPERELLKQSVSTVLRVLLWCGFQMRPPKRTNDGYHAAMHSLKTADTISEATRAAQDFDKQHKSNHFEDFEKMVERRLDKLEQQTAMFGSKLDKVLAALEKWSSSSTADKWHIPNDSDSEHDEHAEGLDDFAAGDPALTIPASTPFAGPASAKIDREHSTSHPTTAPHQNNTHKHGQRKKKGIDNIATALTKMPARDKDSPP